VLNKLTLRTLHRQRNGDVEMTVYLSGALAPALAGVRSNSTATLSV